MAKDDNPPPYEDVVAQAKDANIPEASHDRLPPPPAYTPGPVYGGQHVGQTGAYPPRSATIRTLSARVSSSNSDDMDDSLSDQFESTSVRHAFIRKVYLILAAQLSFTFSVVAIFTFVEPVNQFVIKYPAIYYASLALFFVVYCILACCKEPRRCFPLNIVLLAVFTVALSYMAGSIASFYETKAVFIAMIVTAIVCVAVTIFCFQTKVDFTSCGGFLSISAILLTILGIVTAVVLTFQYIPWLHMVFAAVGAILYTLFLVYNTQLLIGNREYSISPEEYVHGALALYLDVVDIFLFILEMTWEAIN